MGENVIVFCVLLLLWIFWSGTLCQMTCAAKTCKMQSRTSGLDSLAVDYGRLWISYLCASIDCSLFPASLPRVVPVLHPEQGPACLV